jgi:hypothetical protein
MYKNFVKNLRKKSNPKKLKTKKFLATRSCPYNQKKLFLGHNNITKD